MAIKMKDWALFGAMSGLLSVVLGPLLKNIPTLQVTFSALTVNVRQNMQSTAGVIGSFGEYLLSKFGAGMTLPGIITAVLAGAVLIVAARFVLDLLSFEPKKDGVKLAAVYLVATVLEMVVVTGLGVPAFGSVMAWVIGSAALAVLMMVAYKLLGMKLPA